MSRLLIAVGTGAVAVAAAAAMAVPAQAAGHVRGNERTCAASTQVGYAACLARVVTLDGRPMAGKPSPNAAPSRP